jgi:hypothetical protein
MKKVILLITIFISAPSFAETSIEITKNDQVKLIKEALRLQKEVKDGRCTYKEAFLEKDTYNDGSVSFRISGEKKSFNIGGANFIQTTNELFNRSENLRSVKYNTSFGSFERVVVRIFHQLCSFEEGVYLIY